MQIIKVNTLIANEIVDKDYKNGYIARLFCYEDNCYGVQVLTHDTIFNPYTGKHENITKINICANEAKVLKEVLGYDVERVELQYGEGYSVRKLDAYKRINN